MSDMTTSEQSRVERWYLPHGGKMKCRNPKDSPNATLYPEHWDEFVTAEDHRQEIERLQQELEQVRANYALMTAERNRWRDDCDVLTRNRDALEAELKKFVAHSIGPRGAEQMSSNELVCHIEEVVADYDAPKCLVVDCGQPATKDGSWCDKHYNANHIWP